LTNDRLALARATAAERYPLSIPAVEGEALWRHVAQEKAQTTLEVGLAYGVSALYICDALLAAGGNRPRHLAMDPFQSTRFDDAGLELLANAGLSQMVDFRPQRSELVLPALLAEGRQFDFAFVDGNHRFDWVYVDLVFVGRLVKPGGVIFVDDYQLPAIAKAVSFFLGNRSWTLEGTSLPPANDATHGWAVLRTADPSDERDFTDFTDF
jgi:predicted O-methyltransferase YrrM